MGDEQIYCFFQEFNSGTENTHTTVNSAKAGIQQSLALL